MDDFPRLDAPKVHRLLLLLRTLFQSGDRTHGVDEEVSGKKGIKILRPNAATCCRVRAITANQHIRQHFSLLTIGQAAGQKRRESGAEDFFLGCLDIVGNSFEAVFLGFVIVESIGRHRIMIPRLAYAS